MSILSSFVLVLLCFSCHGCNARAFGIVDEDQAEGIKQHPTIQKNEKVNSNKDSVQSNYTKISVTSDSENAKPETGTDEFKGVSESIDRLQAENNQVLKVSDATRVEPRESVSWKVPHKERGEPEVPGFNLDYLPPRTHPPVHN